MRIVPGMCWFLLLAPVVAGAQVRFPALDAGDPAARSTEVALATPVRLTLADAIDLARRRNSRQKAAAAGGDVADAQHRQARSSRWPQVSGSVAATRYDEAPNFLFPTGQFGIPGMSIPIPAMALTIPANAFGPGFPPANVPLPVPGSSIDVPAQVFATPPQNVKLFDPDVLVASIKATYPLYTGGLAAGVIAQARAGIDASRHEQRATDAEIVYDTTRAYYAVVLTRQLLGTTRDTLERMEATQELTEAMYQGGSGRVKKTDYLRSKAMVETIRGLAADLEGRLQTAKAGLRAMLELEGDPPDLADDELPTAVAACDPATASQRAGQGSPLIGRIGAGLLAAEAGVRVARSGRLPKVGVFASATYVGNGYKAGLATDENRVSTAVGIGVDIPIFQGFRVVAEEREAQARHRQLEHQLAAAKAGVGFEARRACQDLVQATAQVEAAGEALTAATESRDLNIRAYQDDLVETKDVIEAQLMEAVLAGQHARILFDRLEAAARLRKATGEDAAMVR